MADTMAERKWQGRWLVGALVASLCVNILVLGVIVGAVLHGPPHSQHSEGWTMTRDLPLPYQIDMLRALRADRSKWFEQRRALQGQRQDLAAALESEPFDIGAVRRILESGRRTLDDLAARSSNHLLEQIAKMGPAERADYAKRLRAPRKSRHGAMLDDDPDH
jgi:uncharacterized membrane protein